MVDFRVGAKMDRLGIDILGPFPMTTKGNRCLCIIVDYFMRCVEVFPLPDYSAKTIMHSLVHEFVCRFWAPLEIHTVQGRNFEVLCFTKYVDFLTSTKTAPHHTTPAPTVWWRGSIARWRLSFGAKPPPPSTYPQKILKKSLKTLQHGNQPGEVSNIFIIHLIIIIKSEVSTFPIVVIFFHGCVWDGCTTIFCHLLHIYLGNTGTLFQLFVFSLLMFSLSYLQTIGYIMACRSCSFVCRLHHLIIIIIQTHLKALN